MARSTHKFYHTGVDNQKKADFIFDLRRPGPKELKKWTPEQKENFSKYLGEIEKYFLGYINELKEWIK